MLAWILEHAGLAPGFLIGGVPGNFSDQRAARRPGTRFFVIEADEYDTAFFDKRAKFVHYRPRTADPQQSRIRPRGHLRRTSAPSRNSSITWCAPCPPRAASCGTPATRTSRETLAMGAGRRSKASRARPAPDVTWSLDQPEGGDFSKFVVLEAGRPVGTVRWDLLGAHNAENALAAIGAARHAGVPVIAVHRGAGGVQGREAPHGAARRGARHRGVRRLRASPDRHRLHHRRAAAQGGRASASSRCSSRARPPCAWACIATRSRRRWRRRMRCGCSRRRIWAGMPAPWWRRSAPRARVARSLDELLAGLAGNTQLPATRCSIMSNGGFGGLHGKLLEALAQQATEA